MASTVTTFGGNQSLGEDNFHCQVEADDGVWFDSSGILAASIEIRDLEIGESLTLHCTNVLGPPENDVDGVTGQTVAGDGNDKHVAVTAPYSLWKKFKKSAGSASDVYFCGVRRS